MSFGWNMEEFTVVGKTTYCWRSDEDIINIFQLEIYISCPWKDAAAFAFICVLWSISITIPE